ncbi:hypothetical protein CPLU01_15774 [Colletotrichum plurivorum]|uniref:Uncharacterized protein n=2 Tax=Colletotrichum orchidearum species complex TaxID=2707337 RepID=A0A8H6MSM0_9PEZI|nr:hypothetical protein CSOJ01_14737 [Colletotrichum sojae]KAF6807647.1 hypothetical protein CPLU01_15774 [Colletotrichum plurivorum]
MDYVADEAGNILAAVPVAWTYHTWLEDLLMLLRSVAHGNKHIDYSPSSAFGF